MCTLEALIKSSENFSSDFEVNQRLMLLHGKARKTYFDKYEAVGARPITDETFLVNCNQLGSCKELCLKDLLRKGAG